MNNSIFNNQGVIHIQPIIQPIYNLRKTNQPQMKQVFTQQLKMSKQYIYNLFQKYSIIENELHNTLKQIENIKPITHHFLNKSNQISINQRILTTHHIKKDHIQSYFLCLLSQYFVQSLKDETFTTQRFIINVFCSIYHTFNLYEYMNIDRFINLSHSFYMNYTKHIDHTRNIHASILIIACLYQVYAIYTQHLEQINLELKQLLVPNENIIDKTQIILYNKLKNNMKKLQTYNASNIDIQYPNITICIPQL